MTFIDDKSRFAWVYLLKEESDAAKAIKSFVHKAERQFNAMILRLRTDNEGEYVNTEIESFFDTSVDPVVARCLDAGLQVGLICPNPGTDLIDSGTILRVVDGH